MRNSLQLFVLTAVFGFGICPVTYAQSDSNPTSIIECEVDAYTNYSDISKSRDIKPIYSPKSDTTNIDQTAVISVINIDINPIFDETNPKENNWIFRLANRLHIQTREKVIRDDLLFENNTLLNQTVVDTSERTLNTRRYLNKANINIVSPPCSNEAKVNVVVRDVWTLKPKISFSHSGGKSNSSYGFEDSNFLGTGKALSLMHFSNEFRSGSVIDYQDPNTSLYNSQLRLRYSDNDDGIEKRLTLNRPFLDLNSKWTAEINHNDTTLLESDYVAGEEVASFGHQKIVNSIYYGRHIDQFSKDNQFASRVILGVSKDDDNFSQNIDALTATTVPEDRSDNSVWIEYQNIHNGFIKTSNVRQINRAEYFNLGNQFRARLGYARSNINGPNDGYIIQAENSVGTMLRKNHMILHNISFNGRYTNHGLIDSIFETGISWYWKNMPNGQFLTQLSGVKAYQLYQDNNVILDGDTGLRGYPSHYQTGDRKILFTMEQHFFGEREWFSLFHAGAAVFFDAGRAWGDNLDDPRLLNPSKDRGWVKNIGVGLRFSPTRTGNREEGSHSVLHVDLVKPLDRSAGISAYQWRLTTEKHF